MKVDDAVETIARFFNDLIGAFIPGAVLTLGLSVMHLGPAQVLSASKSMDVGLVIALFLSMVFALGHGVLAIYAQLLDGLLTRSRVTSSFDEAEAELRSSYQMFKRLVQESGGSSVAQAQSSTSSWTYRDLRSVALSISTEASSIGRRFMSISLLCRGIGTATLILLVDFTLCKLFAPQALFPYATAVPALGQAVLLCVMSYVFFKEGEVFYSRAMMTPFSVAIAEMKLRGKSNVDD